MAVITNQTTVACTPEELFDYCVDIRNELEWNPTAVSMEKLTEGPVGVGTKFLARWKGAPSAIEVECLEFDRPLRWVHDNGGPIAVTFTGTVEPAEGGSLLIVRFDARPRGWFRLLFPLFLLMTRRQERANMTHLREAVERRTGHGDRAQRAMSTIDPTPARTEEMAVIHRVFRRGFPMVAELIRNTPPGATERSLPIAAHLDFLLNGIHHHHTGEDENIWPLLLQRATPQADLINRMEGQHAVVAERSEHVRSLLDHWRETAPDGGPLARAIEEFTAALVEHLDDEEAHVVPLIRSHITAKEWQRFGQETFEKFTDSEKLTATGTLEDVATAEEVAWFTGDLPLPIKVMWRLAGRRKYAHYIAEVRGSSRPAGVSEA